jgi:hypothetical protein
MSSGGFVTAPAESLCVCAGTSKLRVLSQTPEPIPVDSVLKEKDLLSGIENFSQRRKGCTGDLNADLCLVIKSVSQRARVESNIEHKGIHSPNKRCTTNTVWANQYRSLDCLLLT